MIEPGHNKGEGSGGSGNARNSGGGGGGDMRKRVNNLVNKQVTSKVRGPATGPQGVPRVEQVLKQPQRAPDATQTSHQTTQSPKQTFTPSKARSSDHPNDLITKERACERCGYDLRGLKVGDRCSECGAVIRSTKSGKDSDSINTCSMEYLRKIHAGAWLAMVGFVIFLASLIAFGHWYGTTYFWLVGLIALGCASVWIAGVFMLHTPRSMRTDVVNADGRPALYWWIVWNRLTQAAWVVALLTLMTSDAVDLKYNVMGGVVGGNPWLAGILHTAGLVMCAISGIGVFTTYLYLSWLSTWAGDDGLSTRFRFSLPFGLFGLAFFGSLTWHLFSTTVMVNRIGPLSLTAVGACFVLTLYISKNMFLAWISFTQMMSWAVRNRETAIEIDEAMTAKINERISENQSEKALGRAARGPRV